MADMPQPDKPPPRADRVARARRAAERTSPLRRRLILAAGWGFIVLGILGLFLPFLQGVLFLAIGLIILSGQSPWAARQLDRFLQRYPRAEEAHDLAHRRLRRLRARHRLWRQRGHKSS